MEVLYAIIAIIFGILSIILFFKVWKMCNDVHVIKDSLLEVRAKKILSSKLSDSLMSDDTAKSAFKVNQLVVIKANEGQFRIASIQADNGVVKYFSSKSNQYYTADQIEDFNTYWENKKTNTKFK